MTHHEIHISSDIGTTSKVRKSAMVSVRLSDEEFQTVQAMAESAGVSVSALLRNLATASEARPATTPAAPLVARAAHASSARPQRPLLAVFTGYGDTRVLTA